MNLGIIFPEFIYNLGIMFEIVELDVMDKYDGQIYIISATTISYITLRILEIFR